MTFCAGAGFFVQERDIVQSLRQRRTRSQPDHNNIMARAVGLKRHFCDGGTDR